MAQFRIIFRAKGPQLLHEDTTVRDRTHSPSANTPSPTNRWHVSRPSYTAHEGSLAAHVAGQPHREKTAALKPAQWSPSAGPTLTLLAETCKRTGDHRRFLHRLSGRSRTDATLHGTARCPGSGKHLRPSNPCGDPRAEVWFLGREQRHRPPEHRDSFPPFRRLERGYARDRGAAPQTERRAAVPDIPIYTSDVGEATQGSSCFGNDIPSLDRSGHQTVAALSSLGRGQIPLDAITLVAVTLHPDLDTTDRKAIGTVQKTRNPVGIMRPVNPTKPGIHSEHPWTLIAPNTKPMLVVRASDIIRTWSRRSEARTAPVRRDPLTYSSITRKAVLVHISGWPRTSHDNRSGLDRQGRRVASRKAAGREPAQREAGSQSACAQRYEAHTLERNEVQGLDADAVSGQIDRGALDILYPARMDGMNIQIRYAWRRDNRNKSVHIPYGTVSHSDYACDVRFLRNGSNTNKCVPSPFQHSDALSQENMHDGAAVAHRRDCGLRCMPGFATKYMAGRAELTRSQQLAKYCSYEPYQLRRSGSPDVIRIGPAWMGGADMSGCRRADARQWRRSCWTSPTVNFNSMSRSGVQALSLLRAARKLSSASTHAVKLSARCAQAGLAARATGVSGACGVGVAVVEKDIEPNPGSASFAAIECWSPGARPPMVSAVKLVCGNANMPMYRLKDNSAFAPPVAEHLFYA
ncbi:uncharacterized protein C8Q71DRAFT_725044 [Rhodofomes roseus]|uniref:Uncharacterized protein n=1 Tax=Rhodofomes roseus TaxID=34475 RepID=A0ABQ8KAB8_9APHY|nr:uncharacterized protein C8Q71DRAFT_725044 [Rhodofomes roseus]KAH9834457.1 hypothetical protein C8Q71DRAFT_725044 [Rhodofomes roseus]